MTQPPPGQFQPPHQPPHQWTQPPPQGQPAQQAWPQQQPQQFPPQQPQQAQQPWPQQPPQQQQWGPGPQQWSAQPPAGAQPAGPGLATHLRRAFDWNLAAIVVTPREQQQLTAAGVEPRLHGMLAWRRSALIVALPLLALSVVIGFYDAVQGGTDGLTGIGKVCVFLPVVVLLLVPLGALRVVATWTEMRRSARVLIVCWALSVVIPLLVALVPLDALVDLDTARQSLIDNGGGQAELAAFDQYVVSARALLAVSYAMTLLPVIITVPSGVLKGAARIKSLFPAAGLPGWFLVAVAPFYSIFTVVVFVIIEQIAGNGLLLVAVGLLAFSPWLYVIHRKLYGRPLSMAEAAKELPRASRLGGILLMVALVLMVIFVLTAKVRGQHVVGDADSAFVSYWQVLRAVGEVIARTLVTTVVFSAIVLAMVFAEWKTARTMRPEIQAEHDSQMQAIERFMASPSAPAQATWATGPAS